MMMHTWYEQYALFQGLLVKEEEKSFYTQSLFFLHENLGINLREFPLAFAFLWKIKSGESIIHHMEQNYEMIPLGDLIPFMIFSEALLLSKGRIELDQTRFIAMFSVFQYLLGQRLAGEMDANNTKIPDIGLFDFDLYDVIYDSLKKRGIMIS